MALGATHYDVEDYVRQAAEEVRGKFGGSWNTYVGHGLPPAAGERRTVDFWHERGRGRALPEATGDAMCAWILGQHQIRPVRVLIWYSWWWRPYIGWQSYGGLHGNHGLGADSHVHVGW